MKTTMKKITAYLLALLLVIQLIPAYAYDEAGTYTSPALTKNSKYLDQLEITSPNGKTVPVGQTLELSATDGYNKLNWQSSDTSVATVEGGVVTGVSAGIVKIKASQEINGKTISDTIVITVVGSSEPSDETETGNGNPDEGSQTVRKVTIVINGAKDKLTYDGTEHTYSGFTVTPAEETENINLVNREKLIVKKDCGTYVVELTESDFEYTGTADEAELIVNDGWMQIKPVSLQIIVDNKTMNEGEAYPNFTATLKGLQGTDTAESLGLTYTVSEDGTISPVIPDDKIIGNYRVTTVMTGTLTVEKLNAQWLYNIAKIGNSYYRLARTEIWTTKDPVKDPAGVLDPKDYQTEDYDFTDIVINLNGKQYVYNCMENAAAIVNGAHYYDAKSKGVNIIKGKISSSKVWLVEEKDQYTDPAVKDTLHRDFEITLHLNENHAQEQIAYNMLSVNGSPDYYKLRKTTIKANPLEEYTKTGEIKAGTYILEMYDFTDVVITIDGTEYQYSPTELDDEYANYYTVSFHNVEKSARFNQNVKWFNNRESWLDGAYEEYGDLPRETTSFHANYKATLHKGKERPAEPENTIDKTNLKVSITSNWPSDKPAYKGTIIKLTAHVSGFEGLEYTLQWQRTDDLENWEDIPGANGRTFSYELNEDTVQYTWRVVATDIR